MTDAIFGRYKYDTRVNAWRDLTTGRTASGATVRGEVDAHTAAAQENIAAFTRALYSGVIDVAQWQVAVAGELKEAHMAQAMFAVGGRDYMGPAEWGRVGGTLRGEYRHLDTFGQQIAAGQVSEAQALARASQYGHATQQSYWSEWGRARETTPAMRNLPYLNQVPGDGGTQCHGNCACYLSYDDGGIYWNLSPADHCGDCVDLASGGPYQAGRM